MSSSPQELRKAYAECERIARSHYENFPVGSLLIPKKHRPHFYALYAFMRTADDYADLPHRSSHEKLKELARWREQLAAIYEGRSIQSPLFLALEETVGRFSLDRTLLERLLDAFEF